MSSNSSEASIHVSQYFKTDQSALSREELKIVPRKIKVPSASKSGISPAIGSDDKHFKPIKKPNRYNRLLPSNNRRKKEGNGKNGIFTKIARQRLKGEGPYHHPEKTRQFPTVVEIEHIQLSSSNENDSIQPPSSDTEKNSSTSWRDFQQELKKKRVFTGAGVRQFLPEIIDQSNINVIEEICRDNDSLMLENSSMNSYEREDIELEDGYCNRDEEEFSMRCQIGDDICSTSPRARLINFIEDMDDEEEAIVRQGRCEQSNYAYSVFAVSLVLLLSYSSFNILK